MEQAESNALGVSLLHWVESFTDVGKVEGWQDLSDGAVIWSILQDVDPAYFQGALPEGSVAFSGEWTRRWQNLRHIEKSISIYYRDVCNGHDDLGAKAGPALKAIAMKASRRDLERLAMMIIRAAMASPESNEPMARRLMGLGREHAMVIATELRNMDDADADITDSEPASRDRSPYPVENGSTRVVKGGSSSAGAEGTYGDPLLEKEEALLQAHATIEKLHASHADIHRQLSELRADKERLQEAFDVYRAEIDGRGRKTATDDAHKKMQRQAENDRVYIEELEGQLQSARGTVDEVERQVLSYKNANEAIEKLRDDLQMSKAENEDLSQKVKANENLKKKIQALQEHERANMALRDELKQSNERYEELDRLKQNVAGLEKEIIEKKGLIRNQEYQVTELTTTRKHAEYEARVLAQKLEAARDRIEKDHTAMEDLCQKLQDIRVSQPEIPETPLDQDKQLGGDIQEDLSTVALRDDNRHLAEKLALLEEQLEAADSRLKVASERSAAFEDERRAHEQVVVARDAAEAQLLDRDEIIAELRRKTELAAEKPQELPTSGVAALERENRLMATAWYDLSSRLQTNGASLSRRRYEPKSWIGKQRVLVGTTSGVNSSRS